MNYRIRGLEPAQFQPLFQLTDTELAQRGMTRQVATSKPGFPCRVTLEDAEPGERLILLNHESHSVDTPYRSAYAIYVRETAKNAALYENAIPPVFCNRPIAFRLFDEDGMLRGADLVLDGQIEAAISRAFESQDIAYIDAHHAAHGCFAARIERG